jgi:hypothetical protein
MRRRITAFSLSTVSLVVLSLASTGVQAAPSDTGAEAKAEHARILEYWTPERMAHAIPRDFVKTDHGFVPAGKGGKPGGGGDSGGGTGAVTGASWSEGGAVVKGTGKVFFTMAGTNYTCSGAVTDDGGREGYSLVLTAGHCAYDETNGSAATNWIFIPGYDEAPTRTCDATKYGCWTSKGLVADRHYATAGGFNTQAITHDWAFAVVDGGGLDGGTQLDGLASFAIDFNAPNAFRYAFGYPAQGKYGGSDLVYCAGDPISDSGTSGNTWGLACDMTPGSSGGPWFKAFGGASGILNSLNSYKYIGGQYKNYMFGPKFNGETSATYATALDATSDTLSG